MICITLDIPPSSNKRLTAKRRLTDIAKWYREYCEIVLPTMYNDRPLEGALLVQMDIYGSDVDIDNLQKCVFDNFTGAIWLDDAQVTRMEVEKFEADSGKPRIEMRISRR